MDLNQLKQYVGKPYSEVQLQLRGMGCIQYSSYSWTHPEPLVRVSFEADVKIYLLILSEDWLDKNNTVQKIEIEIS